MSSCANLKYLEKDQVLLRKNKYEIKGDLNKEEKSIIKNNIDGLIFHKPNVKFLKLFKTRLWLHNKVVHGDLTDTSFVEKVILKKLGEKPKLADSIITQKIENNISNFLATNGYFNNEVSSTTETKNKKGNVTYTIKPNKRKLVDLYNIQTKDSILSSKIAESSIITLGVPLSKNVLDFEKNRIVKSLRNQGYAYFFPNYIEFKVDTTSKTNLQAFIEVPINAVAHTIYQVGNIYINSDFVPTDLEIDVDTNFLYNFYFIKNKASDGYQIKPEAIYKNIVMKSGVLFSQNSYNETIKRLNETGLFKFVDIDIIDKSNGILDVYIKLQPAKKMSIGGALELSSINGSTVGSTFGTSTSLTYKNKNLFGGGEYFEFDISNSLEFILNKKQDSLSLNNSLFNSIDFGVGANLFFPQLMFPMPIYKRGKTFLSANYDFLSRINFYDYQTFNTSYGYEWFETNQQKRKHILKIINVEYINPTTTENFNTRVLDNNLFLKNSFQKGLFIGQSYSYIYQSNIDLLKKEAYYIRINGDFAPININNSSSTFIKSDIDFKWINNLNKGNTLAVRIASGIGVPLTQNQSLPYVKQFFVGGPNSIRAWRIRDLGPGGFVDSLTFNTIQPYQAGNIKLESSIEYRFDIVKAFYLEGAVFGDAGNIWTLKDDPNRKCPDGTNCSGFDGNFYKNIAVGAGFGIRFDFSYFIIRLDLGYKIKNPHKDDNTYWNYHSNNPFTWKSVFGDATYNLALGYPF